jgi:hypothetical protein
VRRPPKIEILIDITRQAAEDGHLLYSSHANERMAQRNIIKPEVEYILSNGHHEARKDKFNKEFESWDYAIKGKTIDGRNLRIIIAIISPNVLVVTAIDLDLKE